MVVVLTRHEMSLRQEYVNSILRPGSLKNFFAHFYITKNPSDKQKFRRGRIPGAKAFMRDYGVRMLRTYRSQIQVEYDTYYHFEKQRSVRNFDIPPLGRAIRVTDLKGEPIVLTRRRVQGGAYRDVFD